MQLLKYVKFRNLGVQKQTLLYLDQLYKSSLNIAYLDITRVIFQDYNQTKLYFENLYTSTGFQSIAAICNIIQTDIKLLQLNNILKINQLLNNLLITGI